ncbi:LysR family transcriptional regulator [Vibrio sp. D404a]|uniref:LysR family transcriptional regulator n=1 Tax=unclassified Vibrio TaxID=2614977 RepID=UPI002552652D|nr:MULTISPECIES: LysR family transcriptional regulator [unclassified Vibrio]MDK9735954.1 LysR family transcriptional regulator [Vibrio sp. D404a]MDK9797880.1 LysR family transcriptional regulator [Vibrio sp. D449a]
MKSIPTQLPVFIQVAKLGSFAKAARELGISAPAVSKAIGKLEQEWQTKLFLRSSHSLSLTPAGEQLYASLSPSVSSIQNVISQLTDDPSHISGKIKVNLPASSIGQDIILPIIIDFMNLYPDVVCDLSFDDKNVSLVEEGFDLGVGAAINEDSRLVGRPILHTEIGLYASRDYIQKFGTPSSLDDLKSHKCIPVRSITTGKMHKWRLRLNEHALLHEPKGNLVVNNFSAAKEATILGAGITCLGNWMFEEELKQGNIIPVLEHCWGESIPIWLYYSSRAYLPSQVRLLIDFIVEKTNRR